MRKFAILPGLALVGAGALGGCSVTPDISWKSVTFTGVDRDVAFDEAQKILASHSLGTLIRADKANGKLETDPVEESFGTRTLRQQRYLHVVEHDGVIEIAAFAPMFQREIDPIADPPVRWVPIGSDVQVEGILLDEISGRLLALLPDAQVTGTTIPPEARQR
jgi:hypothetical protein